MADTSFLNNINTTDLVNNTLGKIQPNISTPETLANDLRNALYDELKNQLSSQLGDADIQEIINGIAKDLRKQGGGKKGKGKPPKNLPPRRPPEEPQQSSDEPMENEPEDDNEGQGAGEGEEGEQENGKGGDGDTELSEEELDKMVDQIVDEIQKSNPNRRAATDEKEKQNQQGSQGQQGKQDGEKQQGGQQGNQPQSKTDIGNINADDLFKPNKNEPNQSDSSNSSGEKDSYAELRNKIYDKLSKEDPASLSKIIQNISNIVGDSVPDDLQDKADLIKQQDEMIRQAIESATKTYTPYILKNYLKQCSKLITQYFPELLNRRIQGMFGSFEETTKTSGNIVVIIDVSGSMDRDFMSKVVYSLYKLMCKVGNMSKIRLDLVVFADNFEIFLGVKGNTPQNVVAWLNRVSSGGTDLMSVLKGFTGNVAVSATDTKVKKHTKIKMKSLLSKCVGMMLITDFEITDRGANAWINLIKNKTLFKQQRGKVPVINLCVSSGKVSETYNYIVKKIKTGGGRFFNCTAIKSGGD